MKKLFRTKKDKMLGGVCGGLGKALDVDPNIIRVAYAAITLLTYVIPCTIIYLIAWAILPEEDDDEIIAEYTIKDD